MENEAQYGLAMLSGVTLVEAPKLRYQPVATRNYQPGIGLVGCGGISEQHLKAYANAGYKVLALCDRHLERAKTRRDQFFPEASVHQYASEIFNNPAMEVVDLTPHPKDRLVLIEQALKAGKHVLSQKPFVEEVADGRMLVELAAKCQRKLAVNQNGRFAPHFAYALEAVKQGLLGELSSIQMTVHWNHDWIVGTDFEKIHHLILLDFGIHWFDMACCFLGDRKVESVYAVVQRSKSQKAAPPFMASSIIEADGVQVVLNFIADTRFAPQDEMILTGSEGTLKSSGPDLQHQSITLTTAKGTCQPELKGQWFPDGFHGAMAELLLAIEENREPSHSAQNNLKSLRLCQAAVRSADGRVIHPTNFPIDKM